MTNELRTFSTFEAVDDYTKSATFEGGKNVTVDYAPFKGEFYVGVFNASSPHTSTEKDIRARMASLGHHFYQTVMDEDIVDGKILQKPHIRRMVNIFARGVVASVKDIAKENPQFFAPTHGRMGVPAQ